MISASTYGGSRRPRPGSGHDHVPAQRVGTRRVLFAGDISLPPAEAAALTLVFAPFIVRLYRGEELTACMAAS
jgi:hypothetical protein